MSVSLFDVATNIAAAQASSAINSLLQVIPQGSIGGIPIQITIEETATDRLRVTKHPVEQGASITDHSYQLPSELIMKCGWSNSMPGAALNAIVSLFDGGQVALGDYVSSVYSQLLALQQSRQLFTVQSSIRQYSNMLMTDVTLHRDQKTSQALMVTATLEEIFLVSTLSSTLPPTANQASPQDTSDITNVGTQSLSSGTPAPGGSAPATQWTAPPPGFS